MTIIDCICGISIALALACYLEGYVAKLNEKSPVLWWMLMGLLFFGAIIVRLIGGW